MRYIDAEKLKEYLNDRYKVCPISDDERHGRHCAIIEIQNFIDSLQQEQPIQVNTLTWRDINDIERIINNVHYEFRNGIGEKSFGEEVLERFREERDELEQPEVDLEKEIDSEWKKCEPTDEGMGLESANIVNEQFDHIARHFAEWGAIHLNTRK